jgi:hypothetical protein
LDLTDGSPWSFRAPEISAIIRAMAELVGTDILLIPGNDLLVDERAGREKVFQDIAAWADMRV